MVPIANVMISRHDKKETARVGCGPFQACRIFGRKGEWDFSVGGGYPRHIDQ